MKQLSVLIAGLALLAFSCPASEEEIASWRAVKATVFAGREFGEVLVNAAAQGEGFTSTITLLDVTIADNRLSAPSEALAGVKHPQLNTMRVSWEAGHDGQPWLHVSFVLGMPQAGMAAWDYPRVYFAFHKGKLEKRSLAFKRSDGGRTFRDEWISPANGQPAPSMPR